MFDMSGKSLRVSLRFLAAVLAAGLCSSCTSSTGDPRAVILISCDGLRSDSVEGLGPERTPNLHRLMAEGASTHNARTDKDKTNTLPNHTCMITGRGVEGEDGHNWTENNFSSTWGWTLHINKGFYVAGMFDVAHDAGLRTALFATKHKFRVYRESYDATNGAPNEHGRNKIDVFEYVDKDSPPVIALLLDTLAQDPPDLTMLHLWDADGAGHAYGYGSDEYLDAIVVVDHYIGQVLAAIEGSGELRGRTVVIVTTDHGGGVDSGPPLKTTGHGHARSPINFTIPFYVWGPGVEAGADLYKLNRRSRRDPGNRNPLYEARHQPIRNGDAGNLALDLLGLPAIDGSTINRKQNLRVSRW